MDLPVEITTYKKRTPGSIPCELTWDTTSHVSTNFLPEWAWEESLFRLLTPHGQAPHGCLLWSVLLNTAALGVTNWHCRKFEKSINASNTPSYLENTKYHGMWCNLRRRADLRHRGMKLSVAAWLTDQTIKLRLRYEEYKKNEAALSSEIPVDDGSKYGRVVTKEGSWASASKWCAALVFWRPVDWTSFTNLSVTTVIGGRKSGDSWIEEIT